MISKFIIIDDDIFNNILCSLAIKSSLGTVDIRTFTVPEQGLAFLKNEFIVNPEPTILFLDINMPTLTGWEFMEQYEYFSEEIKKHITIYMLSSSVDHRDKDKAKSNSHIKGFISKPLEHEAIISAASVAVSNFEL